MSFQPLSDLIQPVIDLIDASDSAKRANVIRTRFTEDRDPIPSDVRAIVLRRDKYRCVWCSSRDRLEMDHVIPWSAGGEDTVDNLRTLCHDCNSARSNRLSPLDLEARLPQGLSCLRCEPEIAADHLEVIWCVSCRARGRGEPGGLPEWTFSFREVQACTVCDPSGWVKTEDGTVTRCWHGAAMGQTA